MSRFLSLFVRTYVIVTYDDFSEVYRRVSMFRDAWLFDTSTEGAFNWIADQSKVHGKCLIVWRRAHKEGKA